MWPKAAGAGVPLVLGGDRSQHPAEFDVHLILHYLAACNENPKPFVWTMTADQILQSLTRFCERRSGTEH